MTRLQGIRARMKSAFDKGNEIARLSVSGPGDTVACMKFIRQAPADIALLLEVAEAVQIDPVRFGQDGEVYLSDQLKTAMRPLLTEDEPANDLPLDPEEM